MTKTIVFSNQKGGVGKTTTTRELGIYLSEKNFQGFINRLRSASEPFKVPCRYSGLWLI